MFSGVPAIASRRDIQATFKALFKENVVNIMHHPLETQVAGGWVYGRGNVTVTVTPRSGEPMEKSLRCLVIPKR